jgi:excinuclease ABC subunit B
MVGTAPLSETALKPLVANRAALPYSFDWEPRAAERGGHFSRRHAPRRVRIAVPFQLVSPFQPAGDQPQAIAALVEGLRNQRKHQVLMGVTGSGKTFTMANVIQAVQKPTLVLSHNKTLAAQLYAEFKEFFPRNAVHYFVSYYDYYQPEAYIPQRDIYIEKDASINQEIDRLRLAATSALVSRSDVIIVASVSCIYGLGSPEDYKAMMIGLKRGMTVDRDALLMKLVDVQYERNDVEFARGKFRVRGDCVELWPSYEEYALRIEFWGDEVEQLSIINPTSGEVIRVEQDLFVYPAKHFVMPEERIAAAIDSIKQELEERLEVLKGQGKLLEAQRLNARTRFDIEMMLEVGFCPGIENYSRPLSGRPPGSTPQTLFNFFPDDYLLFVDESHATVPQVRGMFAGDHSRKTTLVEHGFRLPSALDNRPLKFDEWQRKINQVIYVSATPGPYELERTDGEFVEQVIRPTGLLDPVIEVSPARTQVPHLLEQIRQRAAAGERVLVTTLTKRLAEDLSFYLCEQGVRCKWLHSELDAFERVQLLRELRQGRFEALVGVNLLREGLDLPEVSLVAILDADKEGFLRSETSLMQTIGRAARNVNAKVLLYADRMTDSMQRAIEETERRRALQQEYNRQHGITPETIRKGIRAGIEAEANAHAQANAAVGRADDAQYITEEYLDELEAEMLAAADNLEFERAAGIRDRIERMRASLGGKVSEVDTRGSGGGDRRRRHGKGGRLPRPKRG